MGGVGRGANAAKRCLGGKLNKNTGGVPLRSTGQRRFFIKQKYLLGYFKLFSEEQEG